METANTTNASATTDVAIETAPETIEADTGVVLDGDSLPVNHRLRAERLAADGKTTDAGGMISDDLIAETSKRMADDARGAEVAKRAAEKANPPVRANMKTDELAKIAEAEGVDLTAASTNADRVDAIIASRTLRGITVDAAAEGESN